MGDSDIGLPKSTMLKAIKERLPEDLRIASDASDVVLRCCDEFIQMVSSTANEISEREKRSTILPEHVVKSVEQLGFDAFLEDINAELDQWKAERKETVKAGKEKKAARNNSGMTAEQMRELQQKLFEEARAQTLTGPLPPLDNAPSNPSAAPEPQLQQQVQQQQQQQVQQIQQPEVTAPAEEPAAAQEPPE